MTEHVNRMVVILVFVCLCIAGGACAQVNLLPQGDFKTPDASTEWADAVLPAGISLNWDKTSVTTVNAKRAQVALDGIWRFIPATEGAAEPAKLGWAYIKVPGSWQRSQGRSSDYVALGGGPPWQLYDGAHVARAWYERQVPIPPEWQGRPISLRFDRVCTDAIAYANGKECGRIAWPWGSVDITSAVTPGQTADVRVLVAAVADAEQVGTFWQNAFMNVSCTAAKLRSRGLTGSVFLEGRSSEARVTDVFVRTSTRKKTVSLDVELSGVKQAGPVQVVADMLNEKGEVEKSFTADAAVTAQETQTLALSWPWADPRLWDVGQPNLYTLRLKVTGAGLDDEYNQKFGFREFWIEGRQLYLNGTVVHLRQPCFYNGPRMEVGDTFWEMGSENVDARGDPSDSGRNLDDTDGKGYLVAQYVLNANRYLMNSRGADSLGAEPAACLGPRRRVDAPLSQSSVRHHVDCRLQFLQQRGGCGPAPDRPSWVGSERRALAPPHGFRQGDVR